MPKEASHVVKFRELHLKPNESIIAWTKGIVGEPMGTGSKTQHRGVLIVTDERVAFYRKGIFGEVIETIPLKAISSIERKSGMVSSTIKMYTSSDYLKFQTFEKDQEQRLMNEIETRRGQSNTTPEPEVEHEPASATPQPNQTTDPIEMLRKLGELKELGVITEEEFQDKKSTFLEKL